MPIFDYHCKKCEKDIEHILKFSEIDDPQKCDDCGEIMIKQFPSSFAFHLKGPNWFSKSKAY